MAVLLPLVPRVAVGDLSVKKDGDVFTADRAVGLGWERVYVHYRSSGKLTVGDVTAVDLRRGDLELKMRGRWRPVSEVDVVLTLAQQRFLVHFGAQ